MNTLLVILLSWAGASAVLFLLALATKDRNHHADQLDMYELRDLDK